jgi:hypothetical protein
MDVEDILLDMERKPVKRNRRSREFVESVDWEMRKGGLDATMDGMRTFVLMAVVRGVYVDAGLGNYDVVVYVAQSVAFRSITENPDENTLGVEGGIVATVEDLRDMSDAALSVAGLVRKGRLRDSDVSTSVFIEAGRKGYNALSVIANSATHHRRFRELAVNFEDYVDALRHTRDSYFS